MPHVDFAILGPGALGSILAAHLARAGHTVVLLARERRAAQIESNGLRITGLADISIRVPVLRDPAQLPSTEVLIVAMKTPGTEEAISRVPKDRIGTAFSIQNGPLKNDILTGAFGPERVLGALANTSGEMSSSGEVLFTRNVNIPIGELSGEISPRAMQIASTLDSAGVRATAVAGIVSLEWSKFVAWVGMMALSVITRTFTWKYLEDAGSATVLAQLVREMGELARALQIEITDQSVLPVATLCNEPPTRGVEILRQIGREFRTNAPQHRMSALQDLEAGRTLEVHETLGYATRRAAELGLTLPLLQAAYQLIAAIDRTR
jgi:2-dehydropantoate 2-reductase